MKYKKRIALLSLVALLGIGVGAYLFFHQEKKAYDYSEFYVATDKEETITEKDPGLEDQVLSLDLLKKRNKDIVGIIEFDDRMIYEPIVQAPDNNYYVRRNIDLNYASAGIPFVSGDGSINSTNVVVYGHSSTEDNIIFTPLMNYLNKSFYNAHPIFHFITDTETREYQIVSVLNIDLNDRNDSLEFSKTEWRNKDSYSSFLESIKKDTLYDTGTDVYSDEKLMTLVTCDTRDGSKRVVIIAKEVTNHEMQ